MVGNQKAKAIFDVWSSLKVRKNVFISERIMYSYYKIIFEIDFLPLLIFASV